MKGWTMKRLIACTALLTQGCLFAAEQGGSQWTTVLNGDMRVTQAARPDLPKRLEFGRQLLLRDLRIAERVQPENAKPGDAKVLGYTLSGSDVRGWAIWAGKEAPVFSVDPRLKGWYAVFFSTYNPDLDELAKYSGILNVRPEPEDSHGTSSVKISSDEFWTPFSPTEGDEVVCPQPGKTSPYYTGDKNIELEIFLGVAKLDGEQVQIRNNNSCVTALRFVPMTRQQVADYDADMQNPTNRRIIINFETYGTKGSILQERIDRYGKSGVGAIHMEFTCGVPNALYGGSKYIDAWGSNITDELMDYMKASMKEHLSVQREYLASGTTPFDYAVPAARKAGIKVMATSRMSGGSYAEKDPKDWDKFSVDDYSTLFNGRFHRDHPELRMPPSTGAPKLDYYYPEVQEYVINVFCEAAEMLDVDGMVMDFTRSPPFIRKEADISVMVDFIKEMRRRLDEVGKRKDKRLLLAAELVDGMYNIPLPDQRVDVEAWLTSGALDYLVIEGQEITYGIIDEKPDKSLEEYVALGKKLSVPVYPRNDRKFLLGLSAEQCGTSTPPLPPGIYSLGHDEYWGDEFITDPMAGKGPECGPLHYQMGVLKYYDTGAEKVVLSNRWRAELGIRRLGNIEDLRELNKKGLVFGEREGQKVEWDRKVQSSLNLVDPVVWKNGTAKLTVKLSIKNTGKVNSSGTVAMTLSGAEVFDESQFGDIQYDLKPGQSISREFLLMTSATGFAIKTASEDPAFTDAILNWRPRVWPMTRIPAVSSPDKVPDALSSERWQLIHWHGTPTATLRMAAAGDAFALHAKVIEPKGLLNRSKFEVFASVKGTSEVVPLAFIPVEPKPGTVNSWMVSELTDKGPGGIAKAPYREMSSLTWRPLWINGLGFADVHGIVGKADGIIYFANRFSVSQTGRWEINIGHDGGMRVLVDGKHVLTESYTLNPATPGRSKVVVELEKGEHEVVIAFDTAKGRGWGIFFSWKIPESEQKNNKQRIFPIVLKSEQFPYEITNTPEGYEIKALIPRELLGLSQDAKKFELELSTTTGAADFGWYANSLFGMSIHNRGFMKVIID
jgi:hypothetical protein